METVFNFIRLALPLAILSTAAACGDDGGDGGLSDAQPAIDQYAANVRAGYTDSLAGATALKTAIDAFVAAPDAPKLEAAKTAWLAAREPYGQTEVFRFYEGPIDNEETGLEGEINAWPLDEVYIDTLVNDTAFEINKANIAGKNEMGGDKNIATGYHAIEYLLWGADESPTGPGTRAFTDYTTATNADRRKQYLAAITELLVDDLTATNDAWAEGSAYRVDFTTTAGPKEALRRIMLGMGSLAGAELSGERMTVALENRDQEDEHSCFSDNTHRDIYANARAVENAYLGRWGTTDGPGLDDIVEARDPALNTKLKMQLTATAAAIAAIPMPFDQAITDDAKRPMVEAAVDALKAETDTIVEVGELLEIQINIE
jgi:putative iron-regulated protein